MWASESGLSSPLEQEKDDEEYGRRAGKPALHILTPWINLSKTTHLHSL